MATLEAGGFTLLEVIVAIVILTSTILLVFPNMSASAALSKRNSFYTSVISLESDVLALFMNPSNFEDPKIKAAMLNGLPLPALILRDYSSSLVVAVPATPMQRSSLTPTTLYFTADRKPCGGFDGSNCIIKLEMSLLLIDRPASLPPPAGGVPDWIEGASSGNPVYSYSYRISVDKNFMLMSNRGIKHKDPLSLLDHRWSIPTEYYMAVGNTQVCEPGSLIAGVDPATKELICLRPTDFCKGSVLSKQLKVESSGIGLECVEWKGFSCPANYVVHRLNPSMLDSDRDGTLAPVPTSDQYGVCVYLGADTASLTKEDPALASATCPAKYTMSGACELINEVTVDCQAVDAFGVVTTTPPNKGVVQTTLVGSQIDCQKIDPVTVCNAPYAGGSWTATVRASASCNLSSGEKFAQLVVK